MAMDEGDTDEALTKEALTMMQKKLPNYVVSCFLAAGYDTLEVISELDPSDEPGNSIDMIEQYINKEHPENLMCNRSMSAPLKFPPGHRKRIANFVDDVKKYIKLQKIPQIQVGQKRPLKCSDPKVPIKKSAKSDSSTMSVSSMCTASGSESSNESAQITDEFSMMGDIRQHIVKWQKKQQDHKVRELKEHKHFEIKIDLQSKGESASLVAVSIQCKICGKPITLGFKNDKALISNWTRHIVDCVREHPACMAQKLDSFFMSSSKTPVPKQTSMSDKPIVIMDDDPTMNAEPNVCVENSYEGTCT